MLAETIEELDARYRVVFVMREMGNFSIQETAGVLELSIPAAKTVCCGHAGECASSHSDASARPVRRGRPESLESSAFLRVLRVTVVQN
jgi:hypothetical protein